ncbi:MAG: DEAD/DEAH box helicase [Burkholderiales bacterium]|nr:DEAD/DEAH box helicase [Burkholderiales bacterium]
MRASQAGSQQRQQQEVLEAGLLAQVNTWAYHSLPLAELTQSHLGQHRDVSTFPLRLAYALHLLWSERLEALDGVLRPLQNGVDSNETWEATATAVTAAALSVRGQWAAAEASFEAALSTLKRSTGLRKGLLPEMLSLPYVLALLAQQSPAHLDKALKFCLVESGKKQGSIDTPYGLMALAVQMRCGDVPLNLTRFKPVSTEKHHYRIDLWRWLMRAWLKADAPAFELTEVETQAAQRLGALFSSIGLQGLRTQLDAAVAVLQGKPAPEHFFVPAEQAGWRNALAALATLGGAAIPLEDPERTRLLWVVSLNERGGLQDIVPHEQKRSVRGWGKPKEIALARLLKTETWRPEDAAVARAVHPVAHSTRTHRLDLAAAIVALLGHPAVEFDDAPGVAVDLIEGQPELDVVDTGDTLQLRLLPKLPASEVLVSRWPQTEAQQQEAESLRAVTVVRDTPQRARLIRLNAAQKRAAQLIGEQLVVPKSALQELQQVLHGLGTHFQVHADAFQIPATVREVSADARLRAELAPQGDGVSLRLVVTPLGLQGPRLPPGHGRAHLIAAVGKETLGAQRDLALERENVDAVMEACEVLNGASRIATVSADWVIEGADEALSLVEQLPHLSVIAGIDWPKGQPVRVDTASLGQLHVHLRSGREWLVMQGEIKVDEQLVLGLEQLLRLHGESKGRFVPIGEGRYLALTQELRARLDELATVAQSGGKGHAAGELRVPGVAAAWLQGTLDGMVLDADAAFGERLARLAEAQYLVPVLPATLQATFRPYQEEGYAWAMRLARAGFGAVLADDMGLGKTLQALAVLVARAPGGPALIVAPTSLGGNWCAEARRFAPTLTLKVFGDHLEAEREGLITRAAQGDVVVVSYQLLQTHAELFAKQHWHTLVLDEAQAIKNASAKRSLAAFDLQADFRLALSGTPIENRLSELWSIMRLCNPGLLGTLKHFNERLAGPIERDRNKQAQRVLKRLISPFILRRTKAQVLDDLPPRTESTLMIEPDAQERAHYEALRRQALAAAEQAVGSDKAGEAHLNILAQLTKLRRAACDPRLISPELGWVGGKVQAFSALAAELVANGHKALVFSQFVDFLGLLRAPLDAAGIAYQYLDGSTPAVERTRRVAAFQAGEGDLFLISLKAGGFGLNLTVADYVVIADPWWNPAAEDQASGRAHRIGQQRPVTVYRLVNKGTLEERIVALHQHKRELADSVLESDGLGAEVSGVLRADELVALIRGDNALED